MTALSRFAGAISLMFLVLALPDQPYRVEPLRFARLPVEWPVLILALLVFPWRRVAIGIVGGLLALVAVLKIANLIAYSLYGRAFNLLVDPSLIGTALETVAMGQGWIVASLIAVAGAGVIIGAVFVFGRVAATVANVAARGRPPAIGMASMLLVATYPLADVGLTGAQWPVTSTEASAFVADRVSSVVTGVRANRTFTAELASTRFDDVPADRVMAALKGRDVIVVFTEAYGRFALSDPAHAERLTDTLRSFDESITAKGLAARSAWLTSPTFGGQSWLAHVTFMSGLWLDDQHRYESLFLTERGTLISDFKRGGWRTVAIMPEITTRWIEGPWFGYDTIYDHVAFEFAGRPFDYMTMPDQFALATLARRELSTENRAPVFAEVALVSSHFPWIPLPRLVAWNDVGNGQIFDDARSPPRTIDWLDRAQMKRDYADAIDYVLKTLASFAETYGNKNLVMIIVGDHQPMAITGPAAVGNDVPIHLIAGDPTVLDAVSSWGWRDGMVPDEGAPRWRMDEMRARLHQAFTPEAAP
ncbi:MAG: hypothetical protein FJX59_19170 [Alphaproteobacteria bacterium]|nr:hypothetical protein [Alphaproteobacteria bacterium]